MRPISFSLFSDVRNIAFVPLRKRRAHNARNYAHRNAPSQINGRTAIKNASGYLDSGAVTNPHFLSSKNNELGGPKSGASIPLNVLGGYRWPNVVGADRGLLRQIVRAEIGDTR